MPIVRTGPQSEQKRSSKSETSLRRQLKRMKEESNSDKNFTVLNLDMWVGGCLGERILAQAKKKSEKKWTPPRETSINVSVRRKQG